MESQDTTGSSYSPESLYKRCRSYLTYMYTTFGCSTLLLIFLIFWSQGFRQIGMLAITFYYKDVIGLSPTTTQLIRTMTYMVWLVKPLYGMMTDYLPILGYRRKAYMYLSATIGGIATLSILYINDITLAAIAMLTAELAQGISDVIAEAIIVEEARKDPVNGSGSLQSMCWFVMSIGGLIGAPLGGVCLDYLSPQTVIAIMAICPFFMLLSAMLIHEDRVRETLSCRSLNRNLRDLITTIQAPTIYKPLIFIYLSNTISPSFPELMIYFLNDELNFPPSLMAVLSMTGYLTLTIGTLCYNGFFKSWSYRSIMSVGQVILMCTGLMDVVLVTKMHRSIGIPDSIFALGGDTVQNMVSFIFRSMPTIVMITQLCPKGVEATLFALNTSVLNFSYTCSIYFGTVLTDVFTVETGHYDWMWLLMLFKSLTKLIPLMFIKLLPEKEEKTQKSEYIELSEESPSSGSSLDPN
jgi:folate/biopterin transporter